MDDKVVDRLLDPLHRGKCPLNRIKYLIPHPEECNCAVKDFKSQLLAALDGAIPESKLLTPQYNGGFDDAVDQYQQNIHQLFGEEGKP